MTCGIDTTLPHHRFHINMTNFIDRLLLSFRKDKESVIELYNILGFYPQNVELYRIALSHKSKSYKNDNGKAINNERLEFLGDAVLETVVSDLVFHRFPNKPEGFLTSTRSKIVQRSSLNRIADEMGLQRLIRTNASKTTHNSYIGGNAFEALVGAIYLDRGFSYCQKFIASKIVGHLIDVEGVAKKEVNFKSKLLEWTQRNHLLVEYNMVPTGKENTNDPEFACCILIEGVRVGEGRGFTKKESHQVAAKKALISLRRNNSLRDGVFHAKEKRTAMEADEICAVPQIDDSDEIVTSLKPGSPVNRQNSRKNPKQQAQQGERRQAKAANQNKPADGGKDKAEAEKKNRQQQSTNSSAKKNDEVRTAAPKAEQRQQRQANAVKPTPTEKKQQRELNGQKNAGETANKPSTKPEQTASGAVRKPEFKKERKAVAVQKGGNDGANGKIFPDVIPISLKKTSLSTDETIIRETESPEATKTVDISLKANSNAVAGTETTIEKKYAVVEVKYGSDEKKYPVVEVKQENAKPIDQSKKNDEKATSRPEKDESNDVALRPADNLAVTSAQEKDEADNAQGSNASNRRNRRNPRRRPTEGRSEGPAEIDKRRNEADARGSQQKGGNKPAETAQTAYDDADKATNENSRQTKRNQGQGQPRNQKSRTNANNDASEADKQREDLIAQAEAEAFENHVD